MKQIIPRLFNQLNITTVISIISLIVSVATLVRETLSKRKKLKIRLLSQFANKDIKALYLNISFENESQLPIAITNIKIIQEKRAIPCSSVPLWIFSSSRSSGKDCELAREVYSDTLPIQLSSLGAARGIIAFARVPDLSKTISNPLTLEVSTNRGKSFQTTLEPCQNVPSLLGTPLY